MEENMIKIKEMLEDESVSFDDFYTFLRDKEEGDWDNVNSEEIIRQYITEKSNEGVHVSHMLEALENNPSDKDLYSIWLGNSMQTPEPINTKQELVEALGIEFN